jgi:hypothetical protein
VQEARVEGGEPVRLGHAPIIARARVEARFNKQYRNLQQTV